MSPVTVSDNDAGVTLSKADLSVAEGTVDDTYTIVLNAKPTSDVTVVVGSGADIAASPTSIVFTSQDWSTPKIVTVSAVDDLFAEAFRSEKDEH